MYNRVLKRVLFLYSIHAPLSLASTHVREAIYTRCVCVCVCTNERYFESNIFSTTAKKRIDAGESDCAKRV